MRRTKVLKKNKHSKKTRKNRKICEKGVTDESIRIRNLTIEIDKSNKSNKSGKSNKLDKYNKPDKSNKSNKSSINDQ